MILQIKTPQLTGKINRAGHENALIIPAFGDLICFSCRFTDYTAPAAFCKKLTNTLRIFCPSVFNGGSSVGAASHIPCQ